MITVTIDPTNSTLANASRSTQQTAGQTLQSWLTVERALYGLILLIATAIRFFHLAIQPLNSIEATNSWTAWLVAGGHQLPMDAAPNSPLLYSLYTTIFWMLDGNDFIARTIPVLCGVGTIWLLWYWRGWLGRPTALVAAALLAFDPWHVAYSRLADSGAVTLFLGMLALTALLRLTEFYVAIETERVDTTADVKEAAAQEAVDGDRVPPHVQWHTGSSTTWQQWAAIGVGLLLISGPQAWNWLVVLALFMIFVMPIALGRQLATEPSVWLLAAGAAILGGTTWLAHPTGLGALSTSLTVWLQSWSAGSTPYPLGWFWIRLVTDEPLLLFFAIFGVRAVREQHTPSFGHAYRFFAFWLLWGLLLALLPGRTPLILAMVSLPLLFFAAAGLSQLWQMLQQGIAWRENGILTLVLAVLFLSGAFWFAALSNNATVDESLARTLALIGILMVLLVVAYALWIDIRQAQLVALSGIGLVLCLWTVSSMWALNHHFDPQYPDGLFQSYTDPDVKNLVDAVTMLSAQRHGDAGELPLQVQMAGTPDPVLGWYLREMRNLTWVLAPGADVNEAPPVVITLSNEVGGEGLSTSYLGSSYAVRDYWLPTNLIATEVAPAINPDMGTLERLRERFNALWSARIRPLWRWMIYHKAMTLPTGDHVVLWVASPSEAAQ